MDLRAAHSAGLSQGHRMAKGVQWPEFGFPVRGLSCAAVDAIVELSIAACVGLGRRGEGGAGYLQRVSRCRYVGQRSPGANSNTLIAGDWAQWGCRHTPVAAEVVA